MPRPNPERKRMMLEDLDSGMTPKEVAEKYGVRPGRVNQIHREAYGPTVRRSDPKYQRLEERLRVLEGKMATVVEVINNYFQSRLVPRNGTIVKK